MPVFSVIIPAYNNSRYLPQCVRSITEQDFRDVEVLIIDDASTDDTYDVARRIAQDDTRVTVLRHAQNKGTLGARKTGMSAAKGDFIMLIDQDDEFAPGTLRRLYDFASAHPADIYHFGVRVEASNPAAQLAAAGMQGFLTPRPRTIQGDDILRVQFSQDGNFDWHVHHKMYRRELAQCAYGMATDERLLLSDDLYMCFLLDSLADAYCAIPDSPWYIYHLGRGDTFGKRLTVEAIDRLALWESQAYRFIEDFVAAHGEQIGRADWADRMHDARTRLVEHTMNEWKDGIDDADKEAGLQAIEAHWRADAVAAELYRYVRDHAYAYFVAADRTSVQAERDRDEALRYLAMASTLEASQARQIRDADNPHYAQMREIAYRHLRDGGLAGEDAGMTDREQDSARSEAEPSPLSRVRHRLNTLFRLARHR